MLRLCHHLLFCILLVEIIASPLDKREIKSGIVPIFDSRQTLEPITFTFSTKAPIQRITTDYKNLIEARGGYPTLTPQDFNKYEPPIQNNYDNYADKWGYRERKTEEPGFLNGANSALIEKLSKQINTPIYNQAQYYRLMQQSLAEPNNAVIRNAEQPPYGAIWKQMSQTWQQMKETVLSTGVERDWRNLWGKLTGAAEPYLAVLSEQLGRLANMFVLQQQKIVRQKEAYRQYGGHQYPKNDNYEISIPAQDAPRE